MGHVLPAIEAYADRLMKSASHPRLGPPTLSVGRIEGGVSVNTVPDSCVIEIDRRLLPGEDPQQAWTDFNVDLMTNPTGSWKCEPVWMACPALEALPAPEFRDRLAKAIN